MNQIRPFKSMCKKVATGCLRLVPCREVARAEEPLLARQSARNDALHTSARVVRLITLVLIFSSPTVAGVDIEKDYPPLPDFEKRVDYVAWFEQAAAKRGDQDSYRAYARFMPELIGSKVEKADWPEFAGMLTMERPPAEAGVAGPAADGSLFSGARGPFPWDPERKPQWEASHQRTREILKQLSSAAKAGPLVWPTGLDGSRDDLANRLTSVLLPHLHPLRRCVHGGLEAAWRVRKGKSSTVSFVKVVETNLRTAGQLDGTPILLEHLVACAIRAKTYEHIRWALAHGLLPAKHSGRVARILDTVDGRALECTLAVRGECAVSLDVLQYVYGPLTGGGIKLNGNRYREITGQNMGAMNRFGLGAQVESDPAGAAKAIRDGYAAIEALMRPGYEDQHYRAIVGHIDRINNFSQITKAMRPAGDFGKIYVTTAVTEASRRGTRLLAELFAHKAKTKKWPQTLASLKGKGIEAVRQDVFRDEPFVYLVVDREPILYSVGPDGQDDGGMHDPNWQSGGDYVFWPIPDSAELIAASRLMRLPDKKLTPLARIGAGIKGKRVVVSAAVAEISSQPDAEHGHRYSVVLEQADTRIELVYFQALADRLTGNQKIAPGKRVRVRAKVRVEDGKAKLHLTDPLNLVIEE